jgi:GNAT superfamily N-acetyltransferase
MMICKEIVMSAQSLMELRRATPQDAGAVRDLVRAAYARWVPVIGREPMPMKADYERAVREHEIDMLVIDGEVVALIETMRRPDHLWIENIAVHPDSQGKGLGRRLLAHAEHKAAAAGCSEIRLLTSAAFETNVLLYEKAGYVIDKREPFMGGTTFYMSKKLGR